MGRIDVIASELTVDPLIRGYSGMSDQAAADDMNAAYRPADTITAARLLSFLLMENTYSLGTGDDTQDRAIWQRMKEVAALTIPTSGSVANPWGATTFNITEIRLIKTNQLVDFVELSAQGDLPIDLDDTNFQNYLAGAQAAGCMSTTQETALLALANNLQTRGDELDVGFVKEGHIAQARA